MWPIGVFSSTASLNARCSSGGCPPRSHVHGEQHPLLDGALAGEEALDGGPGAGGLDVGEVAHLADVDADDRHAVRRPPGRRCAASCRRRRGSRPRRGPSPSDVLVAARARPARRCRRRAAGCAPRGPRPASQAAASRARSAAWRALVVEHEARPRPSASRRFGDRGVDARRRRRAPRRCAGARRAARNSTLPSAPVSGDAMAPMMAAPSCSSAAATSSSTRRHTAGSVITPRPRDASSRPASNCGFTRSTRSAPGAASASTGGSTVRREMNDRSATTRSAGVAEVAGRQVADVGALADLDAGVGAQPLVQLAVADVDGHHRGRAPLEEAVGEPAGRRAEVEGAAALDRRPRTASSAASSFSPPRPTNRGPGPEHAGSARRARRGGPPCRPARRRR